MTSLIVATLLVSLAVADLESQDLQGRLDATVDEYTLAAPSLLHALHKLATDFRLPMGVEWVRDRRSLTPVRLSWRAARVSEIVAQVVAAYPNYRTSTSGTIVHVSLDGLGNVPADPLSVRLGAIDIRNERLSVASGLRIRSRAAQALRPTLSVRGEASSVASGPGGDRRVNITSADPTLRDALDALAVSAGGVIWVVTYPPRGESPAGRWNQTVTLGGHAVAAQFEPHWVFLPWGPPSLVKVSGRAPGPVKR